MYTDPIDILSWIMAVVALTGTYLNTKKDIKGFYFWLFSNAVFTLICFGQKFYPQAFLFLVYTVLSIKGIFEWSKSEKTIDSCTCCK
jgi:nicotinamide mononucleotide transporter PnuC